VAEPAPAGSRSVIIGGAIIALLAAGWFVWSHVVMDTGVGDALGEALGVALGLSVVASVAGAIWSSRAKSG